MIWRAAPRNQPSVFGDPKTPSLMSSDVYVLVSSGAIWTRDFDGGLEGFVEALDLPVMTYSQKPHCHGWRPKHPPRHTLRPRPTPHVGMCGCGRRDAHMMQRRHRPGMELGDHKTRGSIMR